jgi:hypothetical protein
MKRIITIALAVILLAGFASAASAPTATAKNSGPAGTLWLDGYKVLSGYLPNVKIKNATADTLIISPWNADLNFTGSEDITIFMHTTAYAGTDSGQLAGTIEVGADSNAFFYPDTTSAPAVASVTAKTIFANFQAGHSASIWLNAYIPAAVLRTCSRIRVITKKGTDFQANDSTKVERTIGGRSFKVR